MRLAQDCKKHDTKQPKTLMSATSEYDACLNVRSSLTPFQLPPQEPGWQHSGNKEITKS
jgi:hypothetical protein